MLLFPFSLYIIYVVEHISTLCCRRHTHTCTHSTKTTVK